MKRETLTEAQARRLRSLARGEGKAFAAGCSLNQVLQSKGLATKVDEEMSTVRVRYAITPAGRQALADREAQGHG